MNLEQIISALSAAKKWLVQWQLYYILLIAGLGYWLYKDEEKIVELTLINSTEDIEHKAEIRELRKELKADDCVEQFKVWKSALEGEVKSTESKEQTNAEELRLIRQQNKELTETLKILNKQ